MAPGTWLACGGTNTDGAVEGVGVAVWPATSPPPACAIVRIVFTRSRRDARTGLGGDSSCTMSLCCFARAQSTPVCECWARGSRQNRGAGQHRATPDKPAPSRQPSSSPPPSYGRHKNTQHYSLQYTMVEDGVGRSVPPPCPSAVTARSTAGRQWSAAAPPHPHAVAVHAPTPAHTAHRVPLH